MKDNIQVTAASFLGTVGTAWPRFLEISEPILEQLLLVGQIAVAVFTALFIFVKWRNARKK